MSFRSIAWRLVEEPWSWPLSLGPGVQSLRSRWMLEAIDQEGQKHQAELAPCPGVHPESMDEALQLWKDAVQPQLLSSDLKRFPWQWTAPFFGLIASPAVPYTSVQTAAEQLLLSWAQMQNPEEYALPAPMSLAGSALLTLSSWDEFRELWQQGFRVFKCKIGRQAAQLEWDLLRRMTDFGHGQLRLRLDANQNLSADDRLFWELRGRELPIEYWEEAAETEPSARDESLWDLEGPWPDAAAWILKPTRLGLARSVALLQQAARDRRRCVLSNAFDSGLSLRCSAWLYAAFCADPQPLGFGTARYLPNDAWNSHDWAAPKVLIPNSPFAMSEGLS